MVGPKTDNGWDENWQWLGRKLTMVGTKTDNGWDENNNRTR